jgi:hypothetical protein
MQVDVESSKGAGTCKTNKKIFTRNTKIGFRKQPEHPLTLEAYMHDARPHPKCLSCKKEEEIQVAIQTCFKKLVLQTSRLVTNELLGTTTLLIACFSKHHP